MSVESSGAAAKGPSNERILAAGKLFELVHITQPDGRVFEVARRAPGVRLIIADKSKRQVLLTREYRQELGGWDYRLPGGKVFDSLEDYEAHRASGDDILKAAKQKASGEALEEAGIQAESFSLYRKSTLGATVEWDLFVFEAEEWEHDPDGQQLEQGEQIETGWHDFSVAEQMILDGKMQEERIALVLLQWLHDQKGVKA